MIDEYAIQFAIEYLEGKFASGEPADLIGMLNHVDYHERVVMQRQELDEALRKCPSVYVQRLDGRIIFTQ